MNYQFDINKSIKSEVRRIATELVDDARNDCESTELTNHEKIHLIRKRCKRLRALLRIVRPNITSIYRNENIFFRDLARTLSDERDRQVLIESFEAQTNHLNNQNIINDLNSIINKLKTEDDIIDTTELLKDFAKKISENKIRIQNWQIDKVGFKALKGGIKKTYRRGRIAMRVAQKNPSTENYHEWRKRVKYHYYHLELITQIWPTVMKSFVEEVHHLSELLGRDHDLCLLEEKVIENSEFNFQETTKETLLLTIKQEKQKLREEIKILGDKVFTEWPSQLVNRLEGY